MLTVAWDGNLLSRVLCNTFARLEMLTDASPQVDFYWGSESSRKLAEFCRLQGRRSLTTRETALWVVMDGAI